MRLFGTISLALDGSLAELSRLKVALVDLARKRFVRRRPEETVCGCKSAYAEGWRCRNKVRQVKRDNAAFSFVSLAASLLAVLLITGLLQFAQLVGNTKTYLAQDAVPGSAVLVILAFGLLSGLFVKAFRIRWLSREELYFVLVVSIVATPIMGRGFWMGFFPGMTSLLRENRFDFLELLPEELWPHGSNLLEGIFGNPDAWPAVEYGNVEWVSGSNAAMGGGIRLRNSIGDENSHVNFQIPVYEAGEGGVIPGETYMFSVSAAADKLGSEGRYYCRIHDRYRSVILAEVFNLNAEREQTYIQPEGYRVVGRNDIRFPSDFTSPHITVEFGLDGPGEVVYKDFRLMNVDAVTQAMMGRAMVARSDLPRIQGLPKSRLLVRPDSWFHIDGLRFLFRAFTPVKVWLTPFLGWASMVALILCATFAGVAIMRQQWIGNERYPLPLMYVPGAVIEQFESSNDGGVSRIWRHPLFIAGFGSGLLWCVLKGLYGMNPEFPNTRISVPLAPFATDPAFGNMWSGVTFEISATVTSLALLLDIHVAASIVVGFFLFRAQYWFAKANGIAVRGFPFKDEQAIVSLLTYAVVAFVAVRKYLWSYLRRAIRDHGEGEGEEILGHRGAVLLLLGAFAGVVLWARWMGLPALPVTLIFGVIMLLCLVTAKLRAECGIPHTFLFASNAFMLVPILGGVQTLGADTALVFTLLLFLFSGAPIFFLMGGFMLEAQEMGRRFKIKRTHVIGAISLGVVLGFAVGGWSYFGLIHAKGVENLADAARRNLDLVPYQIDLATASADMTETSRVSDKEAPATTKGRGFGIEPKQWCLLYAGGITACFAVLRQIFAGFWFHPVGFFLGYTDAAQRIWGSVLLAMCIRFLVLKLGGAEAVREGLRPFALGLFVAAVLAQSLFAALEAGLYFGGLEINYYWGLLPF